MYVDNEENSPTSACEWSVVRNTAKRKRTGNSPRDLRPISTGLAEQVVIEKYDRLNHHCTILYPDNRWR